MVTTSREIVDGLLSISRTTIGEIVLDRCPLCPNINDPIPCDGPEQCDIFFIGEAPGAMEQKQGKVFVGKTGQELNNHYLPLAGLKREDVRIGNAIKCLPPGHAGKLDI